MVGFAVPLEQTGVGSNNSHIWCSKRGNGRTNNNRDYKVNVIKDEKKGTKKNYAGRCCLVNVAECVSALFLIFWSVLKPGVTPVGDVRLRTFKQLMLGERQERATNN